LLGLSVFPLSPRLFECDRKGDALLAAKTAPQAALGGDHAGLDAAVARARELARSACAPAVGWIAERAVAVQRTAADRALALKRAMRATAGLARYGERYTAARLLCDVLPLVADMNGVAPICPPDSR
jgi:hypothetical protein